MVRGTVAPPAFGRENATGSKRELVSVFGARRKNRIKEDSTRRAAKAASVPSGVAEPCYATNSGAIFTTYAYR